MCTQEILLDHYVGTVDIEAKCMVDMIKQHVYPSTLKAKALNIDAGPDKVKQGAAKILDKLHQMEAAQEGQARARVARELRLDTMVEVRAICDEAEAVIPPEMWTLATYKELLFLDSHHGTTSIAGDGPTVDLS